MARMLARMLRPCPFDTCLRGDVGDLVADDGGELGLGVHVGQQAAEDVDVAAAGGEGVDRAVVEHGEVPFHVGHVAVAGDALAHGVHVVLDGLVFVDAVELGDLVVVLAGGFDLALRRPCLWRWCWRARWRGRQNGRRPRRRASGPRRARPAGDLYVVWSTGASEAAPSPGADQRAAVLAAYFLRNLSTRPAVSSIFCLPV